MPSGAIRPPTVNPSANPFAPQAASSNPLTNQYNLYNSGVQQNAQDYENIMSGYQRLLGQNSNGRPQLDAPSTRSTGNYTPQQASAPGQLNTSQYQASTYRPQQYVPSANSQYTPQQLGSPGTMTPQQYNAQNTQYAQSPDVTASISNLVDLARTGGYSDAGIADLRSRGISPIRAVYANAQQNVDRQRALSGGSGANYGAVTAKMSRDLSDQIANQTSNVNAGIAQNVASNRLQIAPTYASATENQSNLHNQMNETNTAAQNAAGQFNANASNQAQLENIANIMRTNEANQQAYNQAGQFNAGNAIQAGQFNTGQANQAGQFNASAQNQAGQFNANNMNQAQLQNIMNQMQNSQYNAGQANQASQFNIGNQNQNNQQNFQNQFGVAQFNAGQNQLQNQNQQQALAGMQGLYGTTPAMSQLFGNQAMSQSQLQNQIDQQNRQFADYMARGGRSS